MEFIHTKIPDVMLIKSKVFEDQRGFFMESYHVEKFKLAGIDGIFVQDNHAKSVKGTLRGLHFQVNFPQAKLLRCLKGKVFDVAVDLRKDSPYYGQWVGEELSEDNKCQLFIPAGFAHAYYSIEKENIIYYKLDNYYSPKFEKGIIYNDKSLKIKWPNKKIISKKDKNLMSLKEFKKKYKGL